MILDFNECDKYLFIKNDKHKVIDYIKFEQIKDCILFIKCESYTNTYWKEYTISYKPHLNSVYINNIPMDCKTKFIDEPDDIIEYTIVPSISIKAYED